MKATQKLQELGQSLWLDNITRGILNDGTLAGYIRDLSVTGLTSNPTIFDHAMTSGDFYNHLGIAMSQRTYREYRRVLDSPRWFALAAAGALPQRLLFASTSTKDPAAPDTLYVEALAAPDTVNTIPETTLKALADHGRVGETLAADGGNCERVLADFERAGINEAAFAAQLQREGAESFDKSWTDLLDRLAAKRAALATNAHTDAHTA